MSLSWAKPFPINYPPRHFPRCCDNFLPEVASDVICGVTVEDFGVDTRAKFGNLYIKPLLIYLFRSIRSNDDDGTSDMSDNKKPTIRWD